MRNFVINNVRYNAKPFDFNLICSMEENGVPLQDMQKKPMAMLRAYFAECSGLDNEAAGNEIQSHVVGGGNFNDLYKVMGEEMNDSDFFRALKPTETEDAPEVEKKKK